MMARRAWRAFLLRLIEHPRSVRVEWVVLSLALCAAAAGLSVLQGLAPLDDGWYDALVVRHPLARPDDIVLIAIEPDTLDRRDLNRRVWHLGDSADLLERLTNSQPAAVLLNVDLSVTNPQDADGEARLAAAIKRNGKVVLPIALQTERGEVTGFGLPIAPLANPAAALAQNFNTARQDGIVRHLPLALARGDTRWTHAALAVLEVAGWRQPTARAADGGAPAQTGWRESQRLYLRFVDPQMPFTTFSARQVLNGEAADESLSGKIILIGPVRNENLVAVPAAGRKGRTMSSLEWVANGINTLRQDAGVVPVAPLYCALWNVLAVLAALLAFLLTPTRRHFIVSMCAIALVLLFSAGAFFLLALWLPCAAAVAMTASAYPLWAWRRLEATHRFLADEQAKIMLDHLFAGAQPEVGAGAGAGAKNRSIDQQLLFMRDAGERLRAARKFISEVIESLPTAVLVANADGRLLFANHRAIAAVGLAGELSGIELSAVLYSFHTDRALQDWSAEQSCETGGADGKAYWLDTRRLYGGSGEWIGVILALTEITALRLAEKQRKELLRFVSHDMRSPLASILAVINLRDERNAGGEGDAGRFESIRRYTQQCLELVQEFLQLAYAEGADPVEFTTTDLVAALEGAIDTIEPLASQRQVSLHTQLPSTAFVCGNYHLIERLFTNLIHNAVKFTPAGSVIGIAAALQGRQWRVSIRNPQADALASGQAAPQEDGKLGLAFVRTVVAKHGGEFTIEREAGAISAVVKLDNESAG